MPQPAILVPQFHLLPNDSEIKQRNTTPPSPCVQYISWFWFTRYQNNTTSPIYLTRCSPHPNNVAMVPAPLCSVPDLSEKSVTPSVDTLLPDTVNTEAEIDKVPLRCDQCPLPLHNQCRWCPFMAMPIVPT